MKSYNYQALWPGCSGIRPFAISLLYMAFSGMALPISAQTSDLTLSGDLSASVATTLGEEHNSGYDKELRLTLEAYPQRGIRFRAEGGYTQSYGLASPLAGAFEDGLAQQPEEGSLPPDTDLHREFFLDQAYGSAELTFVELRAGIVPVAWGSAYFYNPSSRTAQPDFPGMDLDRQRGKPGFIFSAALPAGFLVEGYALAAARVSSALPEMDELDMNQFPLGIKTQYRGEYLDLAFGLVRERSLPTQDTQLWFIADLAGYIGSVDWYAEAAFDSFPTGLEFSGGLFYTIPMVDITLRTEYIHLGEGGTSPEDYHIGALLEGSTVLLGQDYVFAVLEKEDPVAAAWKTTGGGIMNLKDGSAALLMEALWLPTDLFELGVQITVFTEEFIKNSGDEYQGEFGGGRLIGAGLEYHPYKSTVALTAKWFF